MATQSPVAAKVETPHAQPPLKPNAPWWRWAVAAGPPTVLTALHARFYGAWIVDDAGITFGYARSIATGAGPVLQPGADEVEGYSNPAWLAILVLGRWLRLFDHGTWFGVPDVLLYPKSIALLCCLGVYAAMFFIAKLVTRHPVAVTLVAGCITSVIPSFVIWTTSGLENSLLALAVMGIAAVLVWAAVTGQLFEINTGVGVGVLAALAALTRPDGAIYVGVFPLAALLVVKRDSLKAAVIASSASVAAFVIPFGTYLAWRVAVFRDYLPNTARAKNQVLPTLAGLGKPAELVVYVGWLSVTLAVVVVAIALSRPSTVRTAITMLLVPLGLAVASYAILNPDWMGQHRFATPIWPLATLVTTLSAFHLLRNISARAGLVAVALATIAVVLSAAGFWASAKEFRAQPTTSLCHVAQETGYIWNGYADILGVRDGTLLAGDAGGAALTSRLKFIDINGLIEREVALFRENRDADGLRDYIFDELRPTFIRFAITNKWRERLGLTDDPRMVENYVRLWNKGSKRSDWARRDVVQDKQSLRAARQWGEEKRELISNRYEEGPEIWWCQDVLRPTSFRDGKPAPSPLTRSGDG